MILKPFDDNDMKQFSCSVAKEQLLWVLDKTENGLKNIWKGHKLWCCGRSFNLFSFLPFKVQLKFAPEKQELADNLMLPKSSWTIFSLCVDEVRDRCKAGRILGSALQRFFWKLGCTTLRSLIKGCAITYLMHNHISLAAFPEVKARICKYSHWLHHQDRFGFYHS